MVCVAFRDTIINTTIYLYYDLCVKQISAVQRKKQQMIITIKKALTKKLCHLP